MNHDLRESVNELNLEQRRAHNERQIRVARAELEYRELEPPAATQCATTVTLKGPFRWVQHSLKKNVFPSQRENEPYEEGKPIY